MWVVQRAQVLGYRRLDFRSCRINPIWQRLPLGYAKQSPVLAATSVLVGSTTVPRLILTRSEAPSSNSLQPRFRPRRLIIDPDVFRIKGTIIPEVLPVTGFFATYASIFTYLHYTVAGQSLAVGSHLIPILSFVVGLLLAFRTNLAYDRFWEGRKLWANFVALSRNLARLTWVSNPSSHVLQDGSPNQAAIQAKERLVRLTIALAVSTKHHLRHEPGPNYPDLVHLLPPEFVERVGSASTGKTKPLIAGTIGARNLPMEISHLMSSQMLELRDKVYIDSNLYGAMVFILNDLVQTISSMERVSSTPMPTAYTVHLKQVLGLYCLALPPQLIGQLALFQVPVVSLAAFALFGVARIGDEIEDPFGYDPNDLKLDQFCEDLKLELEAMMEEPPLTIESRSTT
ncbi:uncharacterized protein SPPG_03761 [Spizellomyces punctatus DAOM BR117]|uniref:Uncharacterized protein n=1 Tax=Spizellomyces punctatus (strain DAOM BR117) TaxID=645134 RepID=A0A0L0HII1_SPIPD|nr:uncharacterized protein SPPG_03761 [Spizellomyces punctatus DAOM BR117]KND00634.1 hypothetical protein SPPG_03761 [Spizellomyces punctatus DAOM BR117]|eukprot:XP_016608673.1 hypothetical protein SPPG_03761 [Spizellomyces punctatus DAOM BR117]